MLHLGEDAVAVVGGGLLEGVGDEALAGLADHAQPEVELGSVGDAELFQYEVLDERGQAGGGRGLALVGGGADVAAKGDGAVVGVGVEVADVSGRSWC